MKEVEAQGDAPNLERDGWTRKIKVSSGLRVWEGYYIENELCFYTEWGDDGEIIHRAILRGYVGEEVQVTSAFGPPWLWLVGGPAEEPVGPSIGLVARLQVQGKVRGK